MFVVIFFSCIPAKAPNIDEILLEFKQAHRSVYDVYQMGVSPREIHSLLQQSFYGEALTREYVEHFSTLFYMAEQETEIEIKQVDYNSIDVLEWGNGILSLDADWSVGGIVTHQQHKHTRVNRYRAVYSLKDIEGHWKIIDTKMRNMQRIRRASDEELLNGEQAGGGYLDPLDLLDAGLLDELPTVDESKEREEE